MTKNAFTTQWLNKRKAIFSTSNNSLDESRKKLGIAKKIAVIPTTGELFEFIGRVWIRNFTDIKNYDAKTKTWKVDLESIGIKIPKENNNPVNHPNHYNSSPAKCSQCGHPIECIDITRHMDFNTGNSVKYCWRAGIKDPEKHIQDLEKARWYLDDEIKMLKERLAEKRK